MIISLKEALEYANKRNIAIGAFNTPNSESLLAVLEASETLDVPVIIMHAQCHENIAPIDFVGPLMVTAAKSSKAKVVVHLDHGEDIDYCQKAIDIGFNSIMIDCSALPFEDNLEYTKKVCEYAHQRNVCVEAELGALPQREGGEIVTNKEDLYTKVELVKTFVDSTKVDALAIAFGTAHGLYKSTPILNMDVITNVKKITDVPLVMHGGSGISTKQYEEVIRRGIRKINYYTYMAYDGYSAAKEYINNKDADFYHNLAFEAKNRMRDNVIKVMKTFANIK